MIYSILLRYITTLPIKLLLAHLSICLDSIFHYVSKWKNCVKNFLKTFVGVTKRRKNRSKLLSFEFYSFMAFEFYSGGRGRKKFVVVVCRAIREKSIKKKRTRSTPMGLARILRALLTLVLPARLLSMFFFPSEQPGFLLFLVPYLHYPNSNPFLSFLLSKGTK